MDSIRRYKLHSCYINENIIRKVLQGTTFTVSHILSPAAKEDSNEACSVRQKQNSKMSACVYYSNMFSGKFISNIYIYIYSCAAEREVPSEADLNGGNSMHFGSFRGEEASIAKGSD